MRNISRFLVNSMVLTMLLATLPTVGWQGLHAQAERSPRVQIIDVNTTQFPELEIAISGTHWPAPLADLPATLTLDGHALPIQTDRTTQQGMQLALAIDVNQLVTRNAAGQSGYVELTGTLLDLVEANVFLRSQDWLAAYHLQGDSAPQAVQTWTQEPNLLFNSVVSNRPTAVTDRPLAAQPLIDLVLSMGDLPAAAALPKVLLLFSAGVTVTDLSQILDVAQRARVAIHVVELLNGAEVPASDTLQQLATQSGGHYTALTAPERSSEVSKALAAAHTVRLLQARADSATPQSLTVALTLPDATTVDATVDPSLLADITVAPVEITLEAPTAETLSWHDLTSGPTLDPNARLLSVQTGFRWPTGVARAIMQVSYTLRGPAGFAQQEIRTAAPFDQATLPLIGLREGAYTLEIRALDELGLEAALAPVTLRFSDLPAASPAALAANSAATDEQETTASAAEIGSTGAERVVEAGVVAAAPPQQSDTATGRGDIVQIPGLRMAVPRALLVWSLPILLLLIGYLLYGERRERRRQSHAPQRALQRPLSAAPLSPVQGSDPQFDLQDDSRPVAGNQYQLNPMGQHAARRYAIDNSPQMDVPEAATIRDEDLFDEVPMPTRNRVSEKRPPQTAPPAWQEREAPMWGAADLAGEATETDSDEEITVAPPLEDEEATFRAEDVARPIIGYLVRSTSDPHLPKELPIYHLTSAHGELRQIHIGRHSKHNTVVINDKRISREHALIVQREGRLYLRDNDSTAGTFLNWKRLNPGEELLLRPNDLVSFGEIGYTFHMPDGE